MVGSSSRPMMGDASRRAERLRRMRAIQGGGRSGTLGGPAMMTSDRRRMALHRHGQAHPERLRGKLQNGRFRGECLNATLSSTLAESRRAINLMEGGGTPPRTKLGLGEHDAGRVRIETTLARIATRGQDRTAGLLPKPEETLSGKLLRRGSLSRGGCGFRCGPGRAV